MLDTEILYDKKYLRWLVFCIVFTFLCKINKFNKKNSSLPKRSKYRLFTLIFDEICAVALDKLCFLLYYIIIGES